MTTEDELRKLLHTRADATTWKLTVDDVVNNDFVADVVSIDRGHKRTSFVLSAVATVGALVAGGAYVAVHRGSTDRVNVGAVTRSTSTDDTSVSTQGPQSASNISLVGMTLLLPKTLPKNLRVQNASATPPGTSNSGPPGFISYTKALQGATADDAIMISASGSIGGGSFGTQPTNPAATATKVHGVDAEYTARAQYKQLTWAENGLLYFVGAMGSITETDLVALANSIGSPPTKSAVFSLPVPANYTVTFDGDPNKPQTWNYNVSYSVRTSIVNKTTTSIIRSRPA
jgi:hypothetical protein